MSSAARRYCSHCNAAFASKIDKCPRDGADLQIRETNPLLGQVLGGRYRLVERLGAGGMGEVYRAEHVTIGKSFAIKVLLGEVAADNDMVARFHREAKALSLLSHRNVVSVADFGETEEGLLYLVTEFVDGTSLSHEIRRGSFGIDRTVHVVRQIGKALSHAHRRGLVHRDLKPDNIMLVQEDDEFDVVKVLDFGIARVVDSENTEPMHQLTTQGIVMGTPAYISPEQAMGTPVDHRADLYSLGVVLYELLSGDTPFRGKNAIELMSKHLREVPPDLSRSDITGEFRALTMQLLEKAPEKRCKDADTFLDRLEALGEGQPSGRYVPLNPAVNSTTSKRLPMRQGSDTLLAPISALSTLDIEGPTPPSGVSSAKLTALPTTQGGGKGARLGIAALALVAVGAGAFALFGLGDADNEKPGEPTEALQPTPTPTPIAPVVAMGAADAALLPLTPPAPAPPDASPPNVETPPQIEAPTRAPKRKPPPTLAALQNDVEKIGKRMTALAKTMSRDDVDSLRRKWMDLATALPSIDDTLEARRKFATRVRKLKSAMKKASNP